VLNLVGGDSLTLTGVVTLIGKNAGTDSILYIAGLKLGGASADNYTLVGTTGSVVVNPLALTLTLSGAMTYNGTNIAPASDLIITASNAATALGSLAANTRRSRRA